MATADNINGNGNTGGNMSAGGNATGGGNTTAGGNMATGNNAGNNATGNATAAGNAMPTGDAAAGGDINVNPSDRQTSEFFKEKLMRDAAEVDQKDIEGLETSLPKKLGKFKLDGLGDGMKWINSMLDKVGTLYAMIRDDNYKLPRKKLTLIAAGLLYFVLPTDLTPDFIPGIGYLDDAMVLSMLWKMVSEEVEAYLALHRQYFPE